MERESFKSRMGFILVSAGCAIGLGNVWKFPYICGQYGGAAFILIYLIFLVILGIPVLTCEFAVGRASRRSVAGAFEKLEPRKTRWHGLKAIGIIGCYMLMMFYTMVGGWMLYYCLRSVRGDFDGADPQMISDAFSGMLADAPTMILWTVIICVIGFAVCFFGLKSGIERISKLMMIALLVIMVVLAIHSITMPGSGEGIKFYLVPDIDKIIENGIGNVVFAALSQAFFTLSLGVGAMLIFGSYLDKDQKLIGEAVSVTSLDTFVALTAGLIVIPACFSFGIQPDSGPNLIFVTLPNIFAGIAGGRIWGGLFFLFMSFAALTTIIAVFENLLAFNKDLFGWSRGKSVAVVAPLMVILSMPCVLGFNLLSDIQPLGQGSTIMDLEDFIVSNNLLPLGSLGYILFCTRSNGWGWDNFTDEANTGRGLGISRSLKGYVSYGIPAIIMVIYLKGYYDKFAPMGNVTLICWMIVAILLLTYVLYCSGIIGKRNN